ncbi:hypothetical protein EYV94_08955 [Puteibacter caeruleilacunae]|nr:hypothetical protein EYV94_08955 [Puteibacter caeruleilacunae]
MTELTIGTRVEHDRYGEGIISRTGITTYEIFFERGGKVELSKNNEDLQVKELNTDREPSNGLSLQEVQEALSFVLDQYGALQEDIPMGEKWNDGIMTLQPGNPDLKPKEIPVEVFFHKIIMVRDRLRVLEQNINSHSKLSDEDKIQLQSYITRIYGSLTTFNVLFSEKEHFFKGVKK